MADDILDMTPKSAPKSKSKSKAKSMNEKLGNALKEMREKIGMTQEEVSERMGIPRSAVSLFESGFRNLKVPEIFDLAKIYRVEVDRILDKATANAKAFTKKPTVHFSTASDIQTVPMAPNPAFPSIEMTVQETYYAPVSAILDTQEAKGIGMSSNNMIKVPLIEKSGFNLYKATMPFQLQGHDPFSFRHMDNLLEHIQNKWPASKPVMEKNYNGIKNMCALHFYTQDD